MLKFFILLVCISVLVDARCKTNRKPCHRHENCCSGCCDSGVCSKNAYCFGPKDICRQHRCMDEETCVPYYNEDCEGDCEPIAMCQVVGKEIDKGDRKRK